VVTANEIRAQMEQAWADYDRERLERGGPLPEDAPTLRLDNRRAPSVIELRDRQPRVVAGEERKAA
jgi:hypothetical protein